MSQITDLLVEGTVTGTDYRKLLCYDVKNINNFRNLKARILDDLKAACAPLESASEVVLRNYTLTDYERTPFNSPAAKSCALSDQESWSSGHGKSCRLLAAAPSPHVPIGPADDSRHAMLAVASRQLYDRAFGGGLVLPLEARVKSAAVQSSAPDAATAASGAGSAPVADAAAEATGSGAAPGSSRVGIASEPFDISVRDFRGRCHSVRVCGCTSVFRLKTGIATALGCSVVSHWRLFHGARPLDDNLDLADYNIAAGATVEVKMTSQQQGRLKNSPGASAAAQSETSGRQANVAVNSGSGSAAGGGGSGKAAPAPSGAPRASQPASGAPRASQPAKSGAAPMVVQVLLPCGRVVQVPRVVTETVPQFLQRILEAEHAILSAPVGGVATAEPSSSSSSSSSFSEGRLPTVGLTSQRQGTTPSSLRDASKGFGQEMLSVWRPSSVCGHTARQLQVAVVGHKLLALLLAAAAVVVAMAAL